MKELRGVGIQNNKILSDMIAVKIKAELKKKENKIQDIIDGLDTSIKYR